MTPLVWLFRLEGATIRIVQRDADGGVEINVLGSDGLRKQQLFQTATDADVFRAVLTAELVGSGFNLAWTNATSATPSGEPR